MCSPDAPDTSKQQQAALQMSELSAEQLAWAKQLYAETAPDRAAATARAKEVSDVQLGAMKQQGALTQDYADYNKDTFRPLEKQIVQDANQYDTEARREAAAGSAMADVEQRIAAERGIGDRALSRMGVDPSSGRSLAMRAGIGMESAKMKAGSAYKARKDVETIGAARKMDAVNLGRGLASNQATSAGLALNQGNSSASNIAATGGIAGQGAALMNSGFSGAQSGLGNAASTYGAISQQQNQANQASGGLWGALGSVGGAFAGSTTGSAGIASLFGMSDENLKEHVTDTNPEEVLQEIESIPVKNWAYRPGAVEGDAGQQHVGPMAQSVAARMGTDIAPGGKMIDLVSLNGKNMAAIQGLGLRGKETDADVQTLTKKVNAIMASKGLQI